MSDDVIRYKDEIEGLIHYSFSKSDGSTRITLCELVAPDYRSFTCKYDHTMLFRANAREPVDCIGCIVNLDAVLSRKSKLTLDYLEP